MRGSVCVIFMYTDNHKHLKILAHVYAATHTNTSTPQTSRQLVSLCLLLTVTVPLLRRVSGCVDWKQEWPHSHPQHPFNQDTASVDVWLSAPVLMSGAAAVEGNQPQLNLGSHMGQRYHTVSGMTWHKLWNLSVVDDRSEWQLSQADHISGGQFNKLSSSPWVVTLRSSEMLDCQQSQTTFLFLWDCGGLEFLSS